MARIRINDITSIGADTLIVSTQNGLVFQTGTTEIFSLGKVPVTKTQVLDSSNLLIQCKNSLYLGSWVGAVFSSQFLTQEDYQITNSLKINNTIYYSTYQSNSPLTLKAFNLSTQNKNTVTIDSSLGYYLVTGLLQDGSDLIIVTETELIRFNLGLGLITNRIQLPSSSTSSLIDNNQIYIGCLDATVKIYDLSFNLVSYFNAGGAPLKLEVDGDIQALGSFGISSYDAQTDSVMTTYFNLALASATIGGQKVITDGLQVIDVLSHNPIASYSLNRDSLLNYSTGYYVSRPIGISTNNSTAAFSWNQTGPANNYQISLASNQSTDLINFSEYSEPSTSNAGVFVPNITPLTQAVGFELFLTLNDPKLASPTLSNLILTTNQAPNQAAEPVNLVKSETLITQTSYPQKFFDQSQVNRKHDSTFSNTITLNDSAIGSYDSTPYGYNYQLTSRVRDQFGRYSKYSYNPLLVNYTSKAFPLSVEPVQNVTFTVVNPQEIFVDWDPVTQLIDGTPIPSSSAVLYKVLRKDESNGIYRVIYGDNLLSLYSDYVCSVEPLGDDTKQLTDGIIDPTHDGDLAALTFIEPVDITFSLDTTRSITHISLSFLQGYAPDQITLQVIKGNTESDPLTFDDIDFSLDQGPLEELTIRPINLIGDKVKLSFIPNSTETLKITEVEIYGENGTTVETFYRDQDVNFKDGSQYYYIVQASITDLVTPTQFVKEQQTLQVGNQALLGLTDSTDSCLRIKLDSANQISNIYPQQSLPTKLQNLASVNIGENIITLGGRSDNDTSNLATNRTYTTQVNSQVLTEITGSKFGPFQVITGVNDTLVLSADNKPNLTITFPAGSNSADNIVFLINKGFNDSSDYGEAYNKIASVRGRQVKLQRSRTDLLDRINIGSGSANDLLGFTNEDLGPFRPRIDMRSNKAYHTAWYSNQYLFVLGGMFDAINKLPTNEILRSKISEGATSFTLFDSVKTLPAPLYGHGQGSKDSSIFIIGGLTNGEVYSDRCYLSNFDPNTNNLTNWIPVSALEIPTAFATIQVVGNFIYMIGGKQNGSVTTEIYRASIDGNYRLSQWTKVGDLPVKNYLAASVVSDDTIFVIGGKNSTERLVKTIYGIQVDINTGDILNISTQQPLPMTLAGATAQIIGSDIYILGGEVNSGYSLGQQIPIVPTNINS